MDRNGSILIRYRPRGSSGYGRWARDCSAIFYFSQERFFRFNHFLSYTYLFSVSFRVLRYTTEKVVSDRKCSREGTNRSRDGVVEIISAGPWVLLNMFRSLCNYYEDGRYASVSHRVRSARDKVTFKYVFKEIMWIASRCLRIPFR